MQTPSFCLAAGAFAAAMVVSGCASHRPVSTSLASMPEAVTSFGAVTSDGWLYVFGGHKGERHDYSAEMVSGSFHRLNLSKGRSWETLPSSTPGQGQPLVAHNGLVYRIGGMAARNHAGNTQDLFSTALAQRYDPKSRRWENLPLLPAPRSSHDAVVVGDNLYVVGGWQVAGGTKDALWFTNALVLDLARPQSGWKEFAQPFQRRALALATLDAKVFCIGGMDSDNETTLAVEVYDTATGQWSKGPDLPTGRHDGFACSAIAQNGGIYVTTFKSDLLRLSADQRSWETVAKVNHPRIAHRLVTAGVRQLIALGGENGDGKTPDLELLTPATTPINPASSTPTMVQAATDSK